MLDVLAERGLDVRDRVLFREIRTPADLERGTGAPGGSIYGTRRTARAAFLRPANRSPVPGLFLVGGSAHPGGGLPLVGLSAAIVAGSSARPERTTRAGWTCTSSSVAAAQRHPGHLDLERSEDELWGAPVLPLGVGPLVEVGTRGPVDVPAVARRILAAAGRPAARA